MDKLFEAGDLHPLRGEDWDEPTFWNSYLVGKDNHREDCRVWNCTITSLREGTSLFKDNKENRPRSTA